MFAHKLLAAVGLAAALLLGVTADASAQPLRAPVRPAPAYRPAPVVVAPTCQTPGHQAPVVLPPRVVVVHPAPVYGHGHGHGRGHGHAHRPTPRHPHGHRF